MMCLSGGWWYSQTVLEIPMPVDHCTIIINRVFNPNRPQMEGLGRVVWMMPTPTFHNQAPRKWWRWWHSHPLWQYHGDGRSDLMIQWAFLCHLSHPSHVIACRPYMAKLNKHLLLKEPQMKADKILGRWRMILYIVWTNCSRWCKVNNFMSFNQTEMSFPASKTSGR